MAAVGSEDEPQELAYQLAKLRAQAELTPVGVFHCDATGLPLRQRALRGHVRSAGGGSP